LWKLKVAVSFDPAALMDTARHPAEKWLESRQLLSERRIYIYREREREPSPLCLFFS
jgi:hypothetical protein